MDLATVGTYVDSTDVAAVDPGLDRGRVSQLSKERQRVLVQSRRRAGGHRCRVFSDRVHFLTEIKASSSII